MADTPTKQERADWIASLDDMTALNPRIALPAHMTPRAVTGLKASSFARKYIVDFEQELARSRGSATLIRAMRARCPHLTLALLELGAKVCHGEAQWP